MDQLQEMQAQIEQWKAMGVHSDAIQAAVQTAYAGGTTPLGLSQWSLGDKPRMEDFNRDNARVDALISELRGELARKVNINEGQKWYELELVNGFQHGALVKYTKTSIGLVHVTGTMSRAETPDAGMVMGVLPEGIRPVYGTPFSIVQQRNGGEAWAAYGWVSGQGELTFPSSPPSGWIANMPFAINVMFFAVQ